MASDLTGQKIKDTYQQVLHVDGGVTSTDKTVYDGDGTSTGLKVSTTGVDVGALKIAGTAVTATAAELNYVDGVTSNIQTQLDSKPDNLSELGVTATASELNVLDGITASTAELNYVDGVTSAIQTQLNAKVEDLGDLGITATAAELNVLDGITASTAELNYTDGVTSSIQTQLNAKAPIASPTFTGTATIPTVDINGGSIDGTAIGSSSASTGAFTSITGTSGVISANSSSTALRITQTGSGNALVVEDSANPDSTPFVVDKDGNVIQGSTSFTLGGSVAPWFAIIGANAYGPQFILENKVADSSGSYSVLRKGRNGAIVNSGDTLGTLTYQGFDGASPINAAQIFAQVDGTPGTNDMPGRLVFSTTPDGASSPVEAMRIRSDRNIGIGGSGASSINIFVQTALTGGANVDGISHRGQVQSSVTGTAGIITTVPSVVDSSFTLGNLRHYGAIQGTKGASATITNQYGFSADSTLTGATNNYGFFSSIASGTGRWNFYAAGSASNYFAGRVGIGVNPQVLLDIQGSPDPSIRVSAYATDANLAPIVALRRSRGTEASPSATVSGDFLGSLFAGGHDGSSWGGNVSAIRFKAKENFTSSNQGTSIEYFVSRLGSNFRTLILTMKSEGQVRFQPLSADPSGAEAGDVYYNSSTNKLKVYNGTSWVDLH